MKEKNKGTRQYVIFSACVCSKSFVAFAKRWVRVTVRQYFAKNLLTVIYKF